MNYLTNQQYIKRLEKTLQTDFNNLVLDNLLEEAPKKQHPNIIHYFFEAKKSFIKDLQRIKNHYGNN